MDAHRLCSIANSLRAPISIDPVIRVVPRAGREGPPEYAFGDTEAAGRRLGRVAEVFEATSREFLSQAVRFRPRLALDLGCGPGHSTRLLAEVTGAARIIGLDSSGPFLESARETASEDMSFLEHDVTSVPTSGPASTSLLRAGGGGSVRADCG